MRFDEITLTGRHVRLEPVSIHHAEGLRRAVSDGELWKLFVTLVPHADAIASYIEDARLLQQSGDGLTFAIIDQVSGLVVGSTRFTKADLAYKRVGIGHTFVAKTYQRTGINTDAKFLMLQYAFEALHLNRVELIADYLNTRSRRAIERIGAKQEGILRNHMVMPDGRVRDSVVFSIIKNEWPGVRQSLEHKLEMELPVVF